jgi:predicted AAA+ superfamily ATPase
VLTGPRRVGKSVALLDLAADLCGRTDVDARQIIHLPCDGMAARDLRRALTLGRELICVGGGEEPTRVWLLDEVSAVKGWTAVLKAARDSASKGFGGDTVVVIRQGDR